MFIADPLKTGTAISTIIKMVLSWYTYILENNLIMAKYVENCFLLENRPRPPTPLNCIYGISLTQVTPVLMSQTAQPCMLTHLPQ